MDKIQLRKHQVEAIDAITKGLNCGQQRMVVEMVAGTGKGIVLAKAVETIIEFGNKKILIVTNRLTERKNIECNLFEDYQDVMKINRDNVYVETEERVLQDLVMNIDVCEFVIFYNMNVSNDIYETLNCKNKTVIAFFTNNLETSHSVFQPKDVVYVYNYEDAVADGCLTPAMDARALEPAIGAYCKLLLKQFRYTRITYGASSDDMSWDLVAENDKHKIWVEYKAYKSQVVSPAAANSMLKNVLMRKIKQDIPPNDIVLLIVFSNVPILKKDEIFARHKIIVWDIENLVFYSKNSPVLIKQLSQISYFPIEYIEGRISEEAEKCRISLVLDENDSVCEIGAESEKTNELIQRLKMCGTGREYSREYEDICESILRVLFEANYFNKLIRQHKTENKHFRMDLIGSLKINQSTEESMHPLWKMIVQHYNSHFVVFEFKNYSKEIDQNMIYITEKYLFDTALRNVAFVISRKGFSESAKFAAEGCLKENGKLIIDISDDDLIKMLELKNDKAADYLLENLEEFLMGISK